MYSLYFGFDNARIDFSFQGIWLSGDSRSGAHVNHLNTAFGRRCLSPAGSRRLFISASRPLAGVSRKTRPSGGRQGALHRRPEFGRRPPSFRDFGGVDVRIRAGAANRQAQISKKKRGRRLKAKSLPKH
jgi:hypothetical protein